VHTKCIVKILSARVTFAPSTNGSARIEGDFVDVVEALDCWVFGAAAGEETRGVVVKTVVLLIIGLRKGRACAGDRVGF
jgi:hypothetical protein